MTGFDHEWKIHPETEEEQKIVLTVHFRPDKLPKDKVEWFEMLSNYAYTTAQLIKQGIMPNKETKDFNSAELV